MNTIVTFPASQAFAARVRLYSRGTPFVHFPVTPNTPELIQDVRPSLASQYRQSSPFTDRQQRSQVLQRKTVIKSTPAKQRGLFGAKRKRS